MSKITGWTKVQDDAGKIIYQNDNSGYNHKVVYLMIAPPTLAYHNTWAVFLYNGNEITEGSIASYPQGIKGFDTKQQAIDFAMDFMRRNPEFERLK
jgi:hypothetical protein